MRLKKIIAASCAAAMTVTMLCTSALAADYGMSYSEDAETGVKTWSLKQDGNASTEMKAVGKVTRSDEQTYEDGDTVAVVRTSDGSTAVTYRGLLDYNGISMYFKDNRPGGNGFDLVPNRYIKYEFPCAGTLTVKAQYRQSSMLQAGPSVGGGVSVSTQPRIAVTQDETITYDGNKYTVNGDVYTSDVIYLYNQATGSNNTTSIHSITFTPAQPTVTVEKLTESNLVNGNDGSVADVFYGTYTSNGETAIKTIRISVNGVEKTLSTGALTGDVYFGVVISYANGNNKGYTPTFTFE